MELVRLQFDKKPTEDEINSENQPVERNAYKKTSSLQKLADGTWEYNGEKVEELMSYDICVAYLPVVRVGVLGRNKVNFVEVHAGSSQACIENDGQIGVCQAQEGNVKITDYHGSPSTVFARYIGKEM